MSQTTMTHKSQPEYSGRFDTLDALRGIAALCVMILHCGSWVGRQIEFGYLAVDFFFCLSGFVLGHTYDRRFRSGLTPAAFLRGRIRRLYPMYLLGTALGFLVFLGGDGAKLIRSSADLLGLAILVISAGLMMPFPFGDSDRPAWPLNNPSWSLSFELIANAAYGYWLWRLGKALLSALVIVGLACLGWTIFTFGSIETGYTLATLPGGFARIAFSFPLGLLIARLHDEGLLAAIPTVHPFIPVAALIGVLACPIFLDRWIIEILALSIMLPLVLILGIRSRDLPSWRDASSALGGISYPLYILHAPIFVAFKTFGPALPAHGVEAFATAGAASLLAVAVAALATRVNSRSLLLRSRT